MSQLAPCDFDARTASSLVRLGQRAYRRFGLFRLRPTVQEILLEATSSVDNPRGTSLCFVNSEAVIEAIWRLSSHSSAGAGPWHARCWWQPANAIVTEAHSF